MTARQAFEHQSKACAALGSPFMARLMSLMADRLQHGPVAHRVLGWPGDPMPSADSVPLRLAGALHALKLDGLALTGVYPPHRVEDDHLWAAVAETLHSHAPRILSWLDSAPQTNEVRRAAPLAAALATIGETTPAPIALLELGCSAGLNLNLDHFDITCGSQRLGNAGACVKIAPDWDGDAPTGQIPPILSRRGVDLHPIDPARADGRLKLLAYLWPDQPDRIDRTDAAIQITRRHPVQITSADAGTWLDQQLAASEPDQTLVVYHTVAWQYFPDDTKARAMAAMQAAPGQVYQFGMESDGGTGACLTLTDHSTGKTRQLGRADFHGRWVHWAG